MVKGDKDVERRPSVRGTSSKRFISPLTRRILTVNLLAIGTLVAGLLYLGEYRRTLIANELSSLDVQAEMFAAALGEGAVVSDAPNGQFLVSDIAYQITRRLVEITGTRARLFRADGTLIVDSRRLGGSGSTVQIEILPLPEGNFDPMDALLRKYDDVARAIRGEGPLPEYQENPIQSAIDFHETSSALTGNSAVAARRFGTDGIVLTAAVPVQRYKKVLGAIMLSKDGRNIRRALQDVRVDILKVVAIALSVTILLSLYLASTIARPIRRLAIAAERIRHDRGRKETIPILTHRRDEIGDLAISLKEMTEALWLRMDAIERFAADVSHEIKNPLTPILLSAQRLRNLFLDTLEKKDAAIIDKTTQTIMDQVQSMDSMVSAFANYANTPEIKKTLVSLNMLINKSASLYDNHDGVRVDLDLSGDLPKLQLDQDAISRVLINLIKNAVEAKKKNTKLNINIKSTLNEKDGLVQLTISDDGKGFPSAIIDQVFEPYITTKEKSGGLGLAIVQNIIEQHDGQIFASNVKPHGARVTIELSIIENPKGTK